jgi:hypothetical protein
VIKRRSLRQEQVPRSGKHGLLGRSYPLTGASDAPVLSRFASTIDKTERGGLPVPFNGKVWAGPPPLEGAASSFSDRAGTTEKRTYKVAGTR